MRSDVKVFLDSFDLLAGLFDATVIVGFGVHMTLDFNVEFDLGLGS